MSSLSLLPTAGSRQGCNTGDSHPRTQGIRSRRAGWTPSYIDSPIFPLDSRPHHPTLPSKARNVMQETHPIISRTKEARNAAHLCPCTPFCCRQGVARRLTHKVMEKADSHYTNVEELPEVESAMLNLKQTDVAYR